MTVFSRHLQQDLALTSSDKAVNQQMDKPNYQIGDGQKYLMASARDIRQLSYIYGFPFLMFRQVPE